MAREILEVEGKHGHGLETSLELVLCILMYQSLPVHGIKASPSGPLWFNVVRPERTVHMKVSTVSQTHLEPVT